MRNGSSSRRRSRVDANCQITLDLVEA